LFVNNMLPDTQSYQEMTTDSALCVDDVKQLALGLTVMYDGASTLLINLLRASVCNAHFPNQWQSLYDDGQKNKIQFVNINPIFVGMKFSDASWYCYKEFQLTLIAVRIHSDATDTATIVLVRWFALFHSVSLTCKKIEPWCDVPTEK
ncbi:calcium-activated BK potassium channel alpha subunit-domain-containing protein, partial [Chytriomyces sp. MP71]